MLFHAYETAEMEHNAKMPKKNLMVISVIYNNTNANSVCLQTVLGFLARHGFNVCVISCPLDSAELEDCIYPDGVVVKRCKNGALAYYIKLMNIKDGGRLKGLVVRFLSKVISKFLLHGNPENAILSRSVYKQVDNVIRAERINAVMSVSLPFANHVLASRLKGKHRNLNWIAYELDPYTHNYNLPYSEVNRRAALESRTLMIADRVLLTKGIWEENERNGFGKSFAEKVHSITLPNLSIGENGRRRRLDAFDAEKISLLFAGNIYGNIRNPAVLLDMLKSIADPQYVLHVYGIGLEKLVKDYAFHDGQVIMHGRVGKEEVLDAIFSSSVLINFGNSMPNQTPSKIFDYIASGKPIVNFCYSQDDTSLMYLKKYPAFLNILNDEATEAGSIRRFIDFCSKYRDTQIPVNTIAELYEDILSDNVCASIGRQLEF